MERVEVFIYGSPYELHLIHIYTTKDGTVKESIFVNEYDYVSDACKDAELLMDHLRKFQISKDDPRYYGLAYFTYEIRIKDDTHDKEYVIY